MLRYCGIRLQQENEQGVYTAWFLGSSEKRIREDLASRDGWKDFIKRSDVKSTVLSEQQLKQETSYGFEAAAKKFRGGAQWVGDRSAVKIKE
jgi:hypothetical protein